VSERTVVWRTPLRGRPVDEEHRASTPLELFVDLCFVVAIAQAGSSLHHALAGGALKYPLGVYPMVFFAIWWAWMNFTWFASAYDTDDVVYRLATFVQVIGVLVLAAGVPRAFDRLDFVVVTIGYTVMRVGLVAQWIRAARAQGPAHGAARRYAWGISLCQLGWIGMLFTPTGARVPGFLVLVVLELAVPVWGERNSVTTWHAGHITERYGLLTLIVLGEVVLACTLAVQSAVDEGSHSGEVWLIAGGAALIVFAMWWLYFDQPAEHVTAHNRERFSRTRRGAFVWGYGHLAVFASAAAVGAGLATAIDRATGHAESVSARTAAFAVDVPVALFVSTTWALHLGTRPHRSWRTWVAPVAAAVMVAGSVVPHSVVLTAGVMVALVVVVVTDRGA
jgi:low temperature requirement protein LtrA